MPSPHEKLAESLAALQALQKAGRRVIQSRELSRVHRERLLANGFLQEVMKGWLISSSPGARPVTVIPRTPRSGNSADAIAASALATIGICHRNNRCSSSRRTPSSRGRSWSTARRGTNHNIELPFGTSLYDLKQSTMPGASDVIVKDGLRLFSPSAALVKVPESFFARQPIETQVALTSLRDPSDVLRLLLTGGNSVEAGAIAGALRRIGRPELADDVVKAMKSAGYDVRESDPFEGCPDLLNGSSGCSPNRDPRSASTWTSRHSRPSSLNALFLSELQVISHCGARSRHAATIARHPAFENASCPRPST